MNWPLIFQLSLFGLAMAIATVFVIPSTIEPLFWLAIFILCAYIIAKRVDRQHFLHGLLVSLANCVWITSAHVLLFDAYIARHQREAQMMGQTPFSPRAMMLIMGPIIGLVSGLVLGLLSVIAARVLRRPA